MHELPAAFFSRFDFVIALFSTSITFNLPPPPLVFLVYLDEYIYKPCSLEIRFVILPPTRGVVARGRLGKGAAHTETPPWLDAHFVFVLQIIFFIQFVL